MHQIKTATTINSQVYQDGLMIRTDVFVKEQNIDPKMEIDDREDQCTYVVLYVDQTPAAVARYFETSDNGLHIQRVAVLKNFRKKGLATEILNYISEQAQNNHYSYLILGAQDHANKFYQQLGYQTVGPQYEEVGIKHHDMKKML